MNALKLTKRLHLTVTQSDDKCFQQHGYDGGSPIYTYHQYFSLRWKHKRGSTRPEGWFHSPYGDAKVEVRWLWTKEHDYFAPEVTFRPHRLAVKIVGKIAEVLKGYDHRLDGGPESLTEKLQATLVTYAEDTDDAYDDWRPLRVPGEPAMVTIARYAS